MNFTFMFYVLLIGAPIGAIITVCLYWNNFFKKLNIERKE